MTDSFLRPGRPERGGRDGQRLIREKAPSHAHWLRLGMAVLFLTVLIAGGCAPAAKSKGGEKTVEVIVTKPINDDITDYQDFTGRLDALKTVDVRPRVSGYILEAPFKEGDVVKEGQLLFQIDPRTYQADLDVAEANLKQAEADRKLQVHKAKRTGS